MGTVLLNLSRKWRSQNFDQIVGQDLVVRILKNSLYLGHYFPVYLFAGQRGCGKTSMARIFAAAVNCDSLIAFQKDPKNFSVPCLTCQSCTAMRVGNHPDFIEIDAASHTGVDNMRNIVESSSLLPIIGRKRVYLIDEAHMLSKAALNAALKILEEPPSTALFILATTNPHKIIDTVRSRCFQLFFISIEQNILKKHLQLICRQESISYEDEALDIISRQSEGSARDALNILEQVRFSNSIVNKTSILKLLGHMSDQQLLDIVEVTLRGTPPQLLKLLNEIDVDRYSAEFVWQRLMILLRSLIWIKHGVSPERIISSSMLVKMSVVNYSLDTLYELTDSLYFHEELFLKTKMQSLLLEMILLGICRKNTKKNDDDNGATKHFVPLIVDEPYEKIDNNSQIEKEAAPIIFSDDGKKQWLHFIEEISLLKDALINSLFKQARFNNYDQVNKTVVIEFAKDLILFKEWIDNACAVWQPVLRKAFEKDVLLECQFTGTSKSDKQSKQGGTQIYKETVQGSPAVIKSQIVQDKEKTPQGALQEQFSSVQHYKKKIISSSKRNEPRFNVSNESEWQIAAMLLRHFPGVITEICEN